MQTELILANNDDIDPGVIRDSLLTLTLPADGEYRSSRRATSARYEHIRRIRSDG